MSKPQKRREGVDEQSEEIDRKLGHYFSPARVADLANRVVPEFDIDPCAHPDQLIQAKHKVEGSVLRGIDGMKMRWEGSAWLNPPSFKALKKDVVANYAFYPQTEWFERGVAQFECGDLHTLLIFSPARAGVKWFNTLVRKCTLQLMFDQRINNWISQRSCEGEKMAPREMLSPFGGSCLFLFTTDSATQLRFIEHGAPEGVILRALPGTEEEEQK